MTPNKPRKQRVAWKKEWDALLGTMPGSALAKKLGVATHTVYLHMRMLDIKYLDDAPWKEMLGKVPDMEISKQFGVHISTVAKYRRELGMPGIKMPSSRQPLADVSDEELVSEPLAKLSVKYAVGQHMLRMELQLRGLAEQRRMYEFRSLAALYTRAAIAGMLVVDDTAHCHTVNRRGIRTEIARLFKCSRERARQLYDETVAVLQRSMEVEKEFDEPKTDEVCSG